MTGLREKNKAKRRTAILDAAVALLEDHPWAEVTTERIAARAEVAAATVYNLVGTRDQLLVALVERVLDGVAGGITGPDWPLDGDPLTVVRRVVDDSTAAFTAQSVAFRRVVAALRLVTGAGGSVDLDPARLQIAGMREAQRAGVLDPGFAPEALGRQVYLSYIGAMLAWADGDLDDDGFAVLTRHGLVAVLAAAALPAHRDRLVEELRELSRQAAPCWRHDRAATQPDATTLNKEPH
jgi:AcrR family transcriptional regulator